MQGPAEVAPATPAKWESCRYAAGRHWVFSRLSQSLYGEAPEMAGQPGGQDYISNRIRFRRVTPSARRCRPTDGGGDDLPPEGVAGGVCEMHGQLG